MFPERVCPLPGRGCWHLTMWGAGRWSEGPSSGHVLTTAGPALSHLSWAEGERLRPLDSRGWVRCGREPVAAICPPPGYTSSSQATRPVMEPVSSRLLFGDLIFLLWWIFVFLWGFDHLANLNLFLLLFVSNLLFMHLFLGGLIFLGIPSRMEALISVAIMRDDFDKSKWDSDLHGVPKKESFNFDDLKV